MLAAMAEDGLDGPLYRQLKPRLLRELKLFEKEKVAWMLPLAQLIRAGLAALEGDREAAVRLLEKAAEGCDRHQLGIYAAAARVRLTAAGKRHPGLGSPSPAALSAATLSARGAKRPDRFCGVVVPGGWSGF
jgi:hypothetical protein